jgi:hypothetical protein
MLDEAVATVTVGVVFACVTVTVGDVPDALL